MIMKIENNGSSNNDDNSGRLLDGYMLFKIMINMLNIQRIQQYGTNPSKRYFLEG